MKLSVQSGLVLLAFTMMVQALTVPLVCIDFKINQDYIARVLCINRDKPEVQCNGHCVLMQKLKKTQETEQSKENQTSKKQTFETFCESLLDFNASVFPPKSPDFSDYRQPATSTYTSDIFHPPKH